MRGYKFFTTIKFRLDAEPEREIRTEGRLKFGTAAAYIRNNIADGKPFMIIDVSVSRKTYVLDDAKFFELATKI